MLFRSDDSMNHILHFGSNHNKEKSCDAIGKFQQIWGPQKTNSDLVKPVGIDQRRKVDKGRRMIPEPGRNSQELKTSQKKIIARAPPSIQSVIKYFPNKKSTVTPTLDSI